MDLATPSYPDPDKLPLHAIDLKIDGDTHSIPRSRLDVRYGDDTILITVPVENLRDRITSARQVDFQLDGARVMGGFREGRDLDENARRSLALAWRNCI